MIFKEATQGIPADMLAQALGVSPQTIRQYRLDPSRSGYRSPPPGWREVVADLLTELGSDIEGRVNILREQTEP